MAKTTLALLALALFAALASATIYYDEQFDGDWRARWVESKHKGADRGKVGTSAGSHSSDEKADLGFQTQEDLRFYQWTSTFTQPFSNAGKDLVLQYRVKLDKTLDCGGAYLKFLPTASGFDATDFNGDTPYSIMFGPDICGSTRRTHFIINYKGENHLRREDLGTSTDTASHVYTLILHADQSYEVLRDGESLGKGSITTDFDVLPPKEIKDPVQSKPKDWVDEEEIDDPADKKPEGWDDIPATISDPDAKKPEDWDSELDGEWTAPTIDNPAFKGAWKPKKIPNPAYKGKWIHPMIPNPAYKDDPTIGQFTAINAVGLEVWQVTSGMILDDILVTDDVALAAERRAAVIKRIEAEKAVKEAKEEEERRKAKEADAKKPKDEADDDDNDDKDGDGNTDDDDDDAADGKKADGKKADAEAAKEEL